MIERRPRFGEIWTAYLDPVTGHEQGGRRPVLVVSQDPFNSVPHELRFIVPVTFRIRGVPAHIWLPAGEGGLAKDSVAMCDQLRSVSLDRFRAYRGMVAPETSEKIKDILVEFLSWAG